MTTKMPTQRKTKVSISPAITLWAMLSHVRAAAMGPYSGKERGETALFRQIFGQMFQRGRTIGAER